MKNLSENRAKTLLCCYPIELRINNTEWLFGHIAHLPWAMWLDSCDSDHVDSRYDIIAWQPKVTLQTNGNETVIDDVVTGEKITSDEDPLSLLNQTQQSFFQSYQLPDCELPFKGGSLGYLSYDLGRRFETLPDIAQNDIQLPEMAMAIFDQAIIYDRKTKQYFLICPQNMHRELLTWLTNLVADTKPADSFNLTSDWQANLSWPEYQQRFNQIQEYLLSGDCYQINLTQRFNACYRGDEFLAYLALRAANNAPFSAFIRLPDSAVISVSPERFLKLADGLVQSKPIKGTKPRYSNTDDDKESALMLANSSKDKAENLMIVDLLRNDISKVCVPGSVKVPHLFAIESFPAVHHLVSTVEGVLGNNFDGTDLLRGAFPGGSITGAPKIRAMEIIDELEPQRRSVYCGSIGYISACGNVDTSITIRTLICKNKKIYCWAGGGIVADSEAKSEYQESFDKVEKILPILAQTKH